MLSDRQIYRPVWPPQIYMYGVFWILCNFKSRPDGSHVLRLSPCTAWVISEALSDLQCWNHVTHGVVAFQTEFRVAICHQQPQSLPFDRALTILIRF